MQSYRARPLDGTKILTRPRIGRRVERPQAQGAAVEEREFKCAVFFALPVVEASGPARLPSCE